MTLSLLKLGLGSLLLVLRGRMMVWMMKISCLQNEQRKKSKKLAKPVEPLIPVNFPHSHRARLLREFLISNHARDKYKE
jgi:hypothetical protein